MASCPNDDPAHRPQARGGIHCFYWNSKTPPGGISGYVNPPDCSDATMTNPQGGPLVPAGKYYQYHSNWIASDSSCSTSNPQLQFACALNADQYPGDRASLIDCCLARTDPADCRPGYCSGSTKCDTLMHALCTGGEFAAGEEEACVAWCGSRPGQCDAGAVDYCVRTEGGSSPDGKAFCACISAPAAQIPGAQGIPPCFDAACVSRGYHTQAMLDLIKAGCPSFCQVGINCYQGHGSQCDISDVIFENVCGESLGGKPWKPIGPPGALPWDPVGPPVGPVPPPLPSGWTPAEIIFLVALFLFLIALGLLAAQRFAQMKARRGAAAMPAPAGAAGA